MNKVKFAAGLRLLLEAVEVVDAEVVDYVVPPAAPAAPVATPKPRGRPPKAAVIDAPAPAVVEADPFADAVPAATLDQVRVALTALRAATSQDAALAVLKPYAANLTDLKAVDYGKVVFDAQNAMPAVKTLAAPAVEADPFAEPAKEADKVFTLEDVKAAVVAAQKRTAQDTVQKIVMAHGGKAASPDGGAMMPSLKALPASEFAATIAAIQALPTTK